MMIFVFFVIVKTTSIRIAYGLQHLAYPLADARSLVLTLHRFCYFIDKVQVKNSLLFAGQKWRRRMGIEPTRDLISPTLALKTRGTTRHQSPPQPKHVLCLIIQDHLSTVISCSIPRCIEIRQVFMLISSSQMICGQTVVTRQYLHPTRSNRKIIELPLQSTT